MDSELHYSIQEGVAVLSLARGGDNVLVPETRLALHSALSRAMADDAADAVVLSAVGRLFSSGMDITEYEHDLREPRVDQLCQAIETAHKPVVAALHGGALGAGLELALAAHTRVVQTGTLVALPEIKLGMLPGSGGAVRLPRLVGAQAAFKLLLTGQAFEAETAMLSPMFVRVVKDDPLPMAIAIARQLAKDGTWPLSREAEQGFSNPIVYQQAISTVRGKIGPEHEVEAEIARCVEAAQLLTFDQAIELERSLSEARRNSVSARALRHVFGAEQRARAMPDLVGTYPKPVEHICILGEADIVPELAIAGLDARKTVTLLAETPQAAAQQAARVKALYDGALEVGRLDILDRDARMRNLTHGTDTSVLDQADLVLDSSSMRLRGLVEKPDRAWCVLDECVPCNIRSNQIGLPCMGLRVYRPAYIPRLAEVATNADTPAKSTARVVSFFGANGGAVLRSKDQPGYLGERLMSSFYRAALVLACAGADPFAIDSAAQSMGFLRGPFRMMEAEGLPYVIARIRHIHQKDMLQEVTLLEARVAQLTDGTAMGTGFYAARDQQIVPDPSVRAWLAAWRTGSHWSKTDLSGVAEASLSLALHAALVNAAAAFLEDGSVLRGSDIDLCMIKGYGFSRSKGGPLKWADIQGLLPIIRAMKALEPMSELWTPHPRVAEMVKQGQRFFN